MWFALPYDYLETMGLWLLALAGAFWLLLWLRRRWGRIQPRSVKWVNLGLSLWMFFAALTAVELYFAVMYDQSDSFNMTNVSKHWFDRHVRPVQKELRFSDREKTVYRDAREFPRTLAEGQRHICFIGDSFTFGHGVADVADRFSDRIGASLERRAPGRFVVSNLADAGRDVHWVQRVLEELAADRLPVHTVVYVLCLNDIETFNPQTEGLYREIGEKRSASFLIHDTYFLNLLYYRIQQARSPKVTGYYSYLEESYRSTAWERMQRKLDEIRQQCQDAGFDLRIVIFPFLHNLGPDYPFAEAHERVAAYCQSRAIPALDLRPVLEAHVAEGLTVNRFDAHPNERAHALAAEAIERALLADVAAGSPSDR